METLADIKREMQIGTKWKAYHLINNMYFGVREIIKKNTISVSFLTERKDGKIVHSCFYFPKVSDIVFINENKFEVNSFDKNGNLWSKLSYEKVR